MKRILLLEQKLDVNSAAVTYAAKIAQGNGAEIACLFLVPSSISTAEWIDTQERLVKEGMDKAQTIGMSLGQHFEEQRVKFSSHAIRFEPGIFLKQMEELMPADLIIAGKLEFPTEMADQGVGSIADLGARFNCPVIDAEAMHRSLKPVPRKVWGTFLLYGLGSAFMYFVFFPRIEQLNKFYMGGGILAGLAIMATVAIHAWVYGSTTECLPKFIKMD